MVNLPCGIQVNVSGNSGVISSSLHENGFLWEDDDTRTHKNRAKGFADGIEALILALACEGIDVHTQEFANAIETAVDGFANNS